MSGFDPIDRLNRLNEYETRRATGFYNDTFVLVRATVTNQTPKLLVSVGSQGETTRFDSVEAMDEKFNQLTGKYDLEENE